MNSYKCIIVDDNEIDILLTQTYIKRYSFLNLLNSFTSVQKAIQFLSENEIDLVFLDIDMPEINGIELRKQFIKKDILCIYITSHPEFALESYNLNALDYIIKPLGKERFDTCMQRLKDYMEIVKKAELFDFNFGKDTLIIKEGNSSSKINLYDIIYLEALKDYTKIITTKKRYTILKSLGKLLKNQEFSSFIRIHKSFAVQKNYIVQIKTKEIVLKNEVTLPIGRSYKNNVNNLLGE